MISSFDYLAHPTRFKPDMKRTFSSRKKSVESANMRNGPTTQFKTMLNIKRWTSLKTLDEAEMRDIF